VEEEPWLRNVGGWRAVMGAFTRIGFVPARAKDLFWHQVGVGVRRFKPDRRQGCDPRRGGFPVGLRAMRRILLGKRLRGRCRRLDSTRGWLANGDQWNLLCGAGAGSGWAGHVRRGRVGVCFRAGPTILPIPAALHHALHRPATFVFPSWRQRPFSDGCPDRGQRQPARTRQRTRRSLPNAAHPTPHATRFSFRAPTP